MAEGQGTSLPGAARHKMGSTLTARKAKSEVNPLDSVHVVFKPCMLMTMQHAHA